MKPYLTTWICLLLVSCSPDTDESGNAMGTSFPDSEATDILCPIHEVPVSKVAASGIEICHNWDPKLGLTVDQVRKRFPYAIWDRNIYQEDNSPGARFPLYHLVCERCQDSWRDYASTHTPRYPIDNFEIVLLGTGEILIHDTSFSPEQITAVARTMPRYGPTGRVYLKAEKTTSTDLIKSVVQACEAGGFSDIVFGSYQGDRPSPSAVQK